jgi:hypothetical protein
LAREAGHAPDVCFARRNGVRLIGTAGEGVMICPVSERPTAKAAEVCFQCPSNPYSDLHA